MSTSQPGDPSSFRFAPQQPILQHGTAAASFPLCDVASVVGISIFAGVRLASIPWEDPGSIAWTVVPMLLTYVGAAPIGLLLVRDGVARLW